jgi:hypothetical protein
MTHQHLRVHHTAHHDTASLLIIQLIAHHNLSAHHTAQPALNELLSVDITGVSVNIASVLRRPRVSILGAQPPARISGVWCQARDLAWAKHSVPGDRRSSA